MFFLLNILRWGPANIHEQCIKASCKFKAGRPSFSNETPLSYKVNWFKSTHACTLLLNLVYPNVCVCVCEN